MKPIGRALGALCIVVLTLAASASWAAISASLDRSRAALGDTLRLTISATDGEDVADIDLAPLAADFEILGRSSSSKTSYINGQFSSSRELLLDITPRREGNLAIPPLRLDGQSTNALALRVGPPPQGSPADQDLVFEAELDRPEVYVQGQVILTLRLQQAINLDDRSITQLQLDNAFVRPLEQNSFQRTINGRNWLVHEVRYAIFPEQSGTLEIPAQTFAARESSGRRSLFDMGGGRQVRRSTEPLVIQVLPRPDSYPAAEWLPASRLTLEESWSTPPEQLQVGESATRTITIVGDGLQGAQLPPIMFPPADGLKYYPDQPVISDSETPTGLQGRRVDSVAVVPTKAGHYRIPELRIPWWDTRSNELRYAVLPARELDISGTGPATTPAAPAPAAAPAPVALAPSAPTTIPLIGGGDSRPWQIASAVTGTGWLVTLLYLLWSRRKRSAPAAAAVADTGEKKAFKALLAACDAGDPQRARQAAITWAAALLAQPGMASLARVGAAFGDTALDTALAALNASLYGDRQAAWDGAALAAACQRLRAQHRGGGRGEPAPLQLYPA